MPVERRSVSLCPLVLFELNTYENKFVFWVIDTHDLHLQLEHTSPHFTCELTHQLVDHSCVNHFSPIVGGWKENNKYKYTILQPSTLDDKVTLPFKQSVVRNSHFPKAC